MKTMSATQRQCEQVDQSLIDAQRLSNLQLSMAVDSREVLRGNQELLIDHDGALYSLRVTRQGKLILTK